MEPEQAPTSGQRNGRNTASSEATSMDHAVDLEAVTTWARENKTLALLGAFAAGVFIGVMMRS